MRNDALIAFVVFQAVFCFLDIYVYSKTNRDIARKGEYVYFGALIIIHIAYLILNSAWSLHEYDALRMSRAVIRLVCTASLWTVTGCAYTFFMFTAEKIQFAPMRSRPVRALCAVPALLSTALIVPSPWTGWVFDLGEADRIIHGPLYLVMVATSSLYLLSVVVIAGHNMATARTTQRRRSSAALLSSVLLIILFVLLDDMLMQASILPVAIFAVILVIFINMQESNIYSDALTGMNNRRKADEFLTERLATVSEENPLYLFMGDLNGFKGINDAYGHAEGDEALILCSDAIKRVVGQYNGFAARFGGDEFLISWQPDRDGEADPEALIDDINRLLDEQTQRTEKPYILNMSIGYWRCENRRETVATCVRKADEMLYMRKAAYYRSRDGRRRASA